MVDNSKEDTPLEKSSCSPHTPPLSTVTASSRYFHYSVNAPLGQYHKCRLQPRGKRHELALYRGSNEPRVHRSGDQSKRRATVLCHHDRASNLDAEV